MKILVLILAASATPVGKLENGKIIKNPFNWNAYTNCIERSGKS